MAHWRADRAIWGPPETGAALVLVLVPLVSTLAVLGRRGEGASLSPAASVTLGSLGLVAAALLFAHARFGTGGRASWPTAGPGIVGGLALAAGLSQSAGPGGPGHTVLGALAAVAAAVVAWGCARLGGLPEWVAPRLATAAGLSALAAATGASPTALGVGATTVLVVAPALVASYLWLSTAAALLRRLVLEGDDEVSRLLAAHARTESALRDGQVRLHQAVTLTAGVVSAQEIIAGLPASAERERLEVVVRDEVLRLQRLLADHDHVDGRPRTAPQDPVDLDGLIERIATSHQARGHRVATRPSGLRVRADADRIGEVLDVLIENAAVHAGDAEISVTARRDSGRIHVEVRDTGPGVDPSLSSSIFEWGTREARSSGQGIGLFVADALARSLGGTLALDPPADGPGGPPHPPGARFVLSVPDPAAGAETRVDRRRASA